METFKPKPWVTPKPFTVQETLGQKNCELLDEMLWTCERLKSVPMLSEETDKLKKRLDEIQYLLGEAIGPDDGHK